MKPVAQAAATTVWAATEPSLAGHGGAYLADCQINEAAPAATDPATAQRLWELSRAVGRSLTQCPTWLSAPRLHPDRDFCERRDLGAVSVPSVQSRCA